MGDVWIFALQTVLWVKRRISYLGSMLLWCVFLLLKKGQTQLFSVAVANRIVVTDY